jgi:RNA recognition motif-containing protein
MKGNYAFISFAEHEGAVAAIEKMNGKPFQGQEIVVEKSRKYLNISF